MSKLTAPLLSFGARGSVAKTVVFSRWRGIPYARQYVVPGNPRTEAQQRTRNIFRSLNRLWLYAPASITAAFDTYALGRQFVGRNAFIGQNQRVLRNSETPTSYEGFVASPGARGGLPVTAVVATPGAADISLALGIPDVPEGWTLVAAHGVAFADQNPQLEFAGEIFSVTESSEPSDIEFTGLEAATEYVTAVWLEWLKPNGDTAYSISTGQNVTTS